MSACLLRHIPRRPVPAPSATRLPRAAMLSLKREARRRRELECAAKVALMQETVARAWDVPVAEIKAPTRRHADVALARQVAMYMTHVVFGFSLSAVGRHFGRDRTTAAHACHQIEDRRDDANFDMLLNRLEYALRFVKTGRLVR